MRRRNRSTFRTISKNWFAFNEKCALTPLELTAASATDAAIQKITFGSVMTSLIISNEEMNNILKIIKYLEESSLLIKDASKTIENEAK